MWRAKISSYVSLHISDLSLLVNMDKGDKFDAGMSDAAAGSADSGLKTVKVVDEGIEAMVDSVQWLSDCGLEIHFSMEENQGNQGFLDKWLTPDMGHTVYKIGWEHPLNHFIQRAGFTSREQKRQPDWASSSQRWGILNIQTLVTINMQRYHIKAPEFTLTLLAILQSPIMPIHFGTDKQEECVYLESPIWTTFMLTKQWGREWYFINTVGMTELRWHHFAIPNKIMDLSNYHK